MNKGPIVFFLIAADFIMLPRVLPSKLLLVCGLFWLIACLWYFSQLVSDDYRQYCA
jgi:hypothetical protein